MSSETMPANAANLAAPKKVNTEVDADTGHEYDGIREYDNRLPNWWLAVLLVSVVWSYGYFFYYHVFDNPGGLWATYKVEAEAFAKLYKPADEAAIMAVAPQAKTDGAALFKTTCAVCHGDKGEGKIGPNLTDNAWLHGGKPAQVYETIWKGVISKGMPSWGPQLGEAKVKLLAAYIATEIKGKNIPNPAKPPEGTPEN